MLPLSAVASLSDAALLERVGSLVASERQITAVLIASLGELDARRLYLGAGCSSLFTYCTQILHLSEHAAYGRIEAARCARRFPEVLARLADGSLTLTAVCLLSPVMTFRNGSVLLNRARHKSKRDVEHIVAEVRPKPSVATIVRKAPSSVSNAVASTHAPSHGSPPAPAEWTSMSIPLPVRPPRPAEVHPLAVETYKVQFTLSRSGYERLRRVQDLLRHTIPNGDAAAIFERALSVLLADLEKTKLAATARPQRPRPAPTKHSRHISASVKREVLRRDGDRCAFVGTHGRCTERAFLELHHVIPFADGGKSSAANLQLRCRAHNQHEATLWAGGDPYQLGLDRVGTRSAKSEGLAGSAPSHGREPP